VIDFNLLFFIYLFITNNLNPMKKKLLGFLFSLIMTGAYAQNYDYTVGNIIYGGVLYYSEGVNYSDQNGTGGSAIDEGSIISSGQSDAYDGAFEVAVDDTAFTNVPAGSDTTLVPNVINTATQTIKGLLVSKHFYFAAGLPIVRLLVKIENPTGVDTNVRVNIVSNLGSDSRTELDSCSTGNISLSNSDRWAITSDGYSPTLPGGDPVNTWVRFGLGTPAAITYFNSKPESGNEFINDSLRVTIPANSFIYIMQFNRLDSTIVAAKANVSMFDNLNTMNSNGLFAGINVSDYSKIVNWDMSILTPTIASSNLSFSNVSTNSFTVNWTNGNGSNRLVLIKQGSAVNQDPSYGSYTSSTVFGSGTQLGTGNYAIYNSNGSSVTVTGLTTNTTYFVKVYEYNGTGSLTSYDTTAALSGSKITSSVTGISSTLGTEKITLSPNPNNGTVAIDYSIENIPSEIRILNSIGEIVKVIPVSSAATSLLLDTSTLENGMYFLHFINSSNKNLVKKMIKY
jgi:hypothetical protein